MGIWDALSGKTYKKNKYVGDNTAYFLQRLITFSDGFERHWCQACLVASDAFVEQLIFEKCEIKDDQGRKTDVNPFHLNLDQLSPDGARQLFRYCVAHRLGMFLLAEQHKELIAEIGLSVDDFEQKIFEIFELDDDHKAAYRATLDQSEENTFAAYRDVYICMHQRAFSREPTMDIASITFVAELLNLSAKIFGQVINQSPSS